MEVSIHELSVTKDILKTVLTVAAENGAKRVVSVTLTIGALRDIVPDLMQRYFDYVSSGTAAERARLDIKRIEVTMSCAQCSQVFSADLRKSLRVLCPSCGGSRSTVLTGREFRIEGIEVQ
jgi:hydrogenase nickel incorporation protein HypA/HybF